MRDCTRASPGSPGPNSGGFGLRGSKSPVIILGFGPDGGNKRLDKLIAAIGFVGVLGGFSLLNKRVSAISLRFYAVRHGNARIGRTTLGCAADCVMPLDVVFI